MSAEIISSQHQINDLKIIEVNRELQTQYLTDFLGRPNEQTCVNLAKGLVNGKVFVVDFEATYGILFHDKSREKVAKMKQEPPGKAASVISTYEGVSKFIDYSVVHPVFKDENSLRKIADTLKNVAFLRFPVNENANVLSKYALQDGNIQVLFLSENNPIMYGLQKINERYALVTSANYSGKEIERYIPHQAKFFAEEIGADGFYTFSQRSISHHETRKRVGSLPIIILPRLSDQTHFGRPVIRIARTANTHIDAVRHLVHAAVDPKIDVEIIDVLANDSKDQNRPKFGAGMPYSNNISERLRNASKPSGLLFRR